MHKHGLLQATLKWPTYKAFLRDAMTARGERYITRYGDFDDSGGRGLDLMIGNTAFQQITKTTTNIIDRPIALQHFPRTDHSLTFADFNTGINQDLIDIHISGKFHYKLLSAIKVKQPKNAPNDHPHFDNTQFHRYNFCKAQNSTTTYKTLPKTTNSQMIFQQKQKPSLQNYGITSKLKRTNSPWNNRQTTL